MRDFNAASCSHNSNLSVLDLSDNKLSELPEDVCYCRRLKTLDISNNDISDLPTGLGYLKLDRLLLAGNPFRSIRQSVINGGTKALLKHLSARGPAPVAIFQNASSTERLQGEGSSSSLPWTNALRESVPTGKIDVVGHSLKNQDVPEFLQAIHDLCDRTNIHTLCLDKNELVSVPAALFAAFEGLKKISANENRCVEILERFPGEQSLRGTLQHVSLFRNLLETGAVDDFLLAIDGQTLQLLNLASNRLAQLPGALFHGNKFSTSLRELHLVSPEPH